MRPMRALTGSGNTALTTWRTPVSSPAAIEAERLRVQESLDYERSQRERNAMGQFATPPALAEDIIASLLDIGLPESIDFLEPSCGSGSFYSALLRLASKERIGSARGRRT